MDRAYARAFQEYGLDVEAGLGTLGLEGVVNRFPQRVRQLVAAALDDWVEVRRLSTARPTRFSVCSRRRLSRRL